MCLHEIIQEYDWKEGSMTSGIKMEGLRSKMYYTKKESRAVQLFSWSIEKAERSGGFQYTTKKKAVRKNERRRCLAQMSISILFILTYIALIDQMYLLHNFTQESCFWLKCNRIL